MPQSLSVVYLQLVFSTKERRPFLRNKSQCRARIRLGHNFSTSLSNRSPGNVSSFTPIDYRRDSWP